MKCPLEIIGEFSEWSNNCQECSHYKECMNASYLDDPVNKEMNNNPTGENFPTHHIIHVHSMIKKDRKEMIEKLLIDNLGKITQDDIEDIIIDIGRYNQGCRKEKIKRQYKKRTEPDDTI
jgi:RNA recognition motif-containing protein